MDGPLIAPEEHFAAIVAALLDKRGITPPEGTGFGSSALKVEGRIFAMLSTKGEFVVKLPRQQVDALVVAGKGQRYDPGHGRLMREWATVDVAFASEWLPLAVDAMTFVASKG